MRIFRALIERVKNALLLSAATEIEADAQARATEQQADLHRQAQKYEAEGLPQFAAQLRAKADAITLDRPLAATVAGAGYLVEPDGALALTASAGPAPAALPPARPTRKRSGKA